MSLYRFVRLTALLTLLRRYRLRVIRMVFLICFATVTAWQYADVAVYMNQHHPEWSGVALITKTLIVYAALFWGFWELGRMLHGDDGTGQPASKETSRAAKKPTVAEAPAAPSPLDALAEKPKLRSRRSRILDPTSQQKPL